MSSILYYSNFCEKCKTILKQLSSSKVKDEVHCGCIDKRARDERTGATYIILENNQKVVLPPNINKVPALLLLKEGNNILFGNEIMNKLQPQTDLYNAKASGYNGEPNAFSMGNDTMGGFGVSSDNYSFWDQDSDELLAKGNGGNRQMYNYATVEFEGKIETPVDDYSPDKVDENAHKNMEEQRNMDLHIGQR